MLVMKLEDMSKKQWAIAKILRAQWSFGPPMHILRVRTFQEKQDKYYWQIMVWHSFGTTNRIQNGLAMPRQIHKNIGR